MIRKEPLIRRFSRFLIRYSGSLKYLQRLPIKYLKIDKSFMDQVTINAYDGALVQGIIALAKSLGLGVVAEGIETLDQFLFLKRHRCQKAQGFLFSKPLLIDDFINTVEQQEKRLNTTQLFSMPRHAPSSFLVNDV